MLGKCFSVTYRTRKSFDNFELFDYEHQFGDQGGQQPVIAYDRVRQQLWFSGGDYKIAPPEEINGVMVSPGIVN